MKTTALSLLLALFICGCQTKKEAIIPIPRNPMKVMFHKTKLIENKDLTYKYYKSYFDFKLVNHNDYPTWYVIKTKDSPGVIRSNAFHNKIGQSGKKQPFIGKKVMTDDLGAGSEGTLIQLDYAGSDPFIAFYLPANGSIEIDRFVINSRELWTYFEIIEAREIYVNSSKQLTEWLPFNALSSAKTVIKGDYEPEIRDIGFVETEGGLKSGYPSTAVNIVMVTPAKTRQGREYKWTVRSGIKR